MWETQQRALLETPSKCAVGDLSEYTLEGSLNIHSGRASQNKLLRSPRIMHWKILGKYTEMLDGALAHPRNTESSAYIFLSPAPMTQLVSLGFGLLRICLAPLKAAQAYAV